MNGGDFSRLSAETDTLESDELEEREWDMAVEWPRVSVSEVATAVIGGTPRRDTPNFWNGDLPWASAKDVASIPGRYLDEVQECITKEGLNSSAAKLMPQGTILITARGTVGALAQLRREMAFNQTCYAILPGSKIDNDFLFYALKGSMAEMRSLTYGTVFETITKKSFDDWGLQLPPLPEQGTIAHILGTLDDKIELNRRMNETLEEMARALFKSWFVDFDPVRAKMEGRWRRGESLPGMPAELYDLVPDGMVDSELGEIPTGWEVSEIGKEVDVVGGSTPSTKETAFWEDGNIHWATPRDLSRLQSPVLVETERKITSAGLRKISSGLLPVGTVLMSSRAPVGYLAIAQVPLAVNQGFIALKCCKRISRGYALFWCEENMDTIKANASGTTFAEISKRNFRPLKVIVPAINVLTMFDGIANPLLERITLNDLESRFLAALRDTLLPKLISGELRTNRWNVKKELTEL